MSGKYWPHGIVRIPPVNSNGNCLKKKKINKLKEEEESVYLEEDAGKDGHKYGHTENNYGSVGQWHVPQSVELTHQTRCAEKCSQK